MNGIGILEYIQYHEWYMQKSWFGRRWIDIRCLYRSVVNLVSRKKEWWANVENPGADYPYKEVPTLEDK